MGLKKEAFATYLYFVSLSVVMPKIKTNSSAKKRFKVTASGKIKFKQAGKRHNLGRKSQKRIRNLRKSSVMEKSFAENILRFRMPYSN
jgi:large subunit ribosomal protein L35